MKALKLVGAVVGACIVLVLGAVAFITSRPGADFIKERLAAAMLAQKQRVLKIDGPLELSLWPVLGLKLGGLTLSEPGGAQEFAAIDAARVAIALQPLRTGQVLTDGIEVSGVRAILIRRKDGTLNIDDLLAPDSPSATPLQFDIAGVRLDKVQLSWRDERDGTAMQLPALSLVSGRIQGDTGQKTFRADRLSVALAEPRDKLAGKLLLEGVAGSPAALTLEKFSGDLTFALPDMPGKQAKLSGQGQLRVDMTKQTAAGRLAARLDKSKLTFAFDVARFAPLSLGFDLDVDSLDLDDYLPARKDKGGAGKLDFAFLEKLDLRGSARIGSLHASGVKASGLRFSITAANGKVRIAPLAAARAQGK